ncbi:hypothetical protein B0H14DRAFT_2549119 [Mycena olivaceomarginata]|nr:hypothetical protein B0H14DRAFT_2549119 [Mycena olivaceomarginata]
MLSPSHLIPLIALSLAAQRVSGAVFGKIASNATAIEQAAADGSFTICKDLIFGTCTEVLYNNGICFNVPTGWNDVVSSVQVPNGAVCSLFKDGGCGGNWIVAIAPGYSNLQSQGFNDIMTAYKCSDAAGCIVP